MEGFMKNNKIYLILFFIAVILIIYNFYLYRNLKNQVDKIEAEIRNKENIKNVSNTLGLLNNIAKDYGLIESEAKLFPSGEEYVLVFKFESKELFEDFLKNKGGSEIFNTWKASLKALKIQKVKFIDKNNNILKVIEKNEM